MQTVERTRNLNSNEQQNEKGTATSTRGIREAALEATQLNPRCKKVYKSTNYVRYFPVLCALMPFIYFRDRVVCRNCLEPLTSTRKMFLGEKFASD